MANHKSALKRVRQNEKRPTGQHKAVKTRVKGTVKSVRQALEAKDAGKGSRGSGRGRADHRQGRQQGSAPPQNRLAEDLPPGQAGSRTFLSLSFLAQPQDEAFQALPSGSACF